MRINDEYRPGNLEDGAKIVRFLVRRSGSREMLSSGALRQGIKTVFDMDEVVFMLSPQTYAYENQANPAIEQHIASANLDEIGSNSVDDRRVTTGVSIATAIRREATASKLIAKHLMTVDPQEVTPVATTCGFAEENYKLRKENAALRAKLAKVKTLAASLGDALDL